MSGGRTFIALALAGGLTAGAAGLLVFARADRAGATIPPANAATPSGDGPSGGAAPAIVAGRATSLADQQRALSQAKAQAARARALSRRYDAQAGQARAEADRLGAQAAALAARVQESEADLRAGEARVAIIGQLIARQRADLAARQQPLIRLTAALQSLSRRPPALTLVRPGSLSDTIHARAAFSQLLPVITRRTTALRADLARSRRLRVMAARANDALATSRTQLATRRTELAELERRRRVAARGLAVQASDAAEQATAMTERARDIGDLMAEIAQAGDVRAQLSALPDPMPRPGTPIAVATPTAPADRPAYRLPVAGTLVTGTGELSDSGVRARGVTLATAPNAVVTAPADGRIAWAGPYRGFGRILIIDHGDGWTSLLADLGHLSVRAGQTVRQGAPVGTAPGGEHPSVLVELRRQERPVDLVALATAR